MSAREFVSNNWKTLLGWGVFLVLGVVAIFAATGTKFSYSSKVEFNRLKAELDEANRQLANARQQQQNG